MKPALGDWLAEAPFTLTLSSGFFSFFAHGGLIAALQEAGLRPARITGSSAGALTGACWAAGLDARELRDRLLALQKQDFWDPAPGLGLLRGERFRTLLRDMLPVSRFADTAIPLALSAWDGLARKTRVLEDGDLVPAVYASCAVPLMFQPARIDGLWLWDGGIGDRAGIAGAGLDDRVFYHHIASRSPWRRPGSPALKIPARDNLQALVISDLPRCGPERLRFGREAFERALAAAREALRAPANGAPIRV